MVKVSHDYVRDVNLQFDEWEQVWQYLTRVSRASYYMHSLLLAIGEQVGQNSTDVRHEFVLQSDILGISALVDAISYPASSGATETSVLGPFHDEEAHSFEYGESITTKGTPGEPTIVHGFIRDTDGKAVPEALIDVWETDGNGIYDLGYEGSQNPNYHGKIFTNSNDHYLFKCVKLVAYLISNNGPVGEPLRKFNRHWHRPAHMVCHSCSVVLRMTLILL